MDTTLYFFKQFQGGRGYLVANINDLMGLITPLYLLAPEEKVNSHGPYLNFEWVIRNMGEFNGITFTAMGHFK